MDAVEDHLHDHVARDERGARKTWLTRSERSHGVEDMRHRLGSARERLARLRGGGVRVSAGDGYPTPAQQLDELERAGELGRQGDMAHRSRLQQAPQQRTVRVAPRLRRMRPQSLGSDERPLEMGAEDSRRAAVPRHLA